MNRPTHVCETECYHYRLYSPGEIVAFIDGAKVPRHFRKLTEEEATRFTGSASVVTQPETAPSSAAPLDPNLAAAIAAGQHRHSHIQAAATTPIPVAAQTLNLGTIPTPAHGAGDEAPKTASKK